MNQSKLNRTNNAHSRREMFVEIHQKSSLIELKLLYDIYKNKDWNALGFLTWKDYCEAPVDSGGLAISREWATQLVLVYKRFVIELGIPETKLLEVSPRKLYGIKDSVTEENVMEMIEKTKSLSLNDLEMELKGTNTMDCKHPHIHDPNAKFLFKCPDCSLYQKLTKKEISKL